MGCETATNFQYSRGLEGVIAAITSISCIDGEEGILIYRGIPIQVMAKNSTFEETAYFLLFGKLPTRTELDYFIGDLKEHRALSEHEIGCILNFPKNAHPMDALRTAVSIMGLNDPMKGAESRDINLRIGIKIIAKIPSLIAAFDRMRKGKEIIQPDSNLSHAENFLYMLRGEKPDTEDARILDIALILHADHGMNASTFGSMVTASTLSDMYSAIVTGIGTLKGPLHGGANERVLKMIKEIGSEDKAEEYVLNALAEHRKIMGFGHRVYKAYDPRAKILKGYAERLSEKNGDMKFINIGKKIEEVMIREVG
ncbi:MAG TPA: citrate synthase, partial [candidate division WOR-3 bacterium]|nr:citrate synthase [candidate division WOR-3 bacterium]